MNKNMYLNAVNQAKPYIVHWINMPTIYPSQMPQSLYIFLHWCLMEEEKDVNRSNIDELDVVFIAPDGTSPNLKGEC